jgi:probable HAF family extracellular repeat protein
LTDLGPGVVPVKINNSEQILETISNGSVFYEYKSGRAIPLPKEGIDLNNAGEVLLSDFPNWGYVSIWQASGKIVTHLIGVQGDYGNHFYPWALNDLGQVVGRDFTIGTFGSNNVVLVQPNGTYKTIAAASTTVTVPTENYVFPKAMNVVGQAVGYDLNEYWNYVYQGPFYDSGDAALYKNGRNILLGNLITQAEGGAGLGSQPPGSEATGINNFGVIVGNCKGVGLHQSLLKAFIYLNGTMYDLNTLVSASGQGLTITEAWGINDLGQIVANATDTAGNTHTVLLSVVGLEDSDVPK